MVIFLRRRQKLPQQEPYLRRQPVQLECLWLRAQRQGVRPRLLMMVKEQPPMKTKNPALNNRPRMTPPHKRTPTLVNLNQLIADVSILRNRISLFFKHLLNYTDDIDHLLSFMEVYGILSISKNGASFSGHVVRNCCHVFIRQRVQVFCHVKSKSSKAQILQYHG